MLVNIPQTAEQASTEDYLGQDTNRAKDGVSCFQHATKGDLTQPEMDQIEMCILSSEKCH